MTGETPAPIWFVRSNGGAGSYPVTPEGWRAVWMFLAGVAASALVGMILATSGPVWLWVLVFVAGMAASAWRFIDVARRHTDYTTTYDEFVKKKAGRAAPSNQGL